MRNPINALVWIAITVVPIIFFGCRKDPREEEAKLRRLDSISDATSADSASQAAFRRALDGRLTLLDEIRLEDACNDCIRIIVSLGWRDSTIGPMMSIVASKKNMKYNLRLRAFPQNKRTDMVDRDLSQADFRNLRGILERVNFSGIPLFEDVDYQVFDANVYYIEQVRDGRYHGISRSARVDDFVFQLASAASLMAGLPKEFLVHFQNPSSRKN